MFNIAKDSTIFDPSFIGSVHDLSEYYIGPLNITILDKKGNFKIDDSKLHESFSEQFKPVCYRYNPILETEKKKAFIGIKEKKVFNIAICDSIPETSFHCLVIFDRFVKVKNNNFLRFKIFDPKPPVIDIISRHNCFSYRHCEISFLVKPECVKKFRTGLVRSLIRIDKKFITKIDIF